MQRQTVNPRQVGGVVEQNIGQDVTNIYDKIKTFERPVQLKSDLPLTGNDDGDVRLVLTENRFYVWDEATESWVADIDQFTEARTFQVVITENRMKNFQVDLTVGQPNGVASLETILVMVNGVLQHKSYDYNLGVTGVSTPKLILEWVSPDFDLEEDDVLLINYDELILR